MHNVFEPQSLFSLIHLSEISPIYKMTLFPSAPKLNAIVGFQWTQNENSTSSKVLNESGNDGKSTKSWNDSFADLTEHRIFMNSCSYPELNARCSGLGDWLWKQRFLYAEKDEDFMKN